jgi:apolipoprotein N-acyltransferase
MTARSDLRLLGLAVLSGLALHLAYSVPWIAWVAVAPLLIALRRASPGQAALLGLVAGIVEETISLLWLLDSGVTPAALAILVLISASKHALFAFGATLLLRHRPAIAPLLLPVLWVALEWLRTNVGWLSIPWGLLGYSQYEVAALVRTASLAGVYGISFVLMVGNVALAEICERWLARGSSGAGEGLPGVPALALSAGLAVLILAAGNLPGPSSGPPGPGLRVAIVQAGVYDPDVHDVRERNAIFDRYVELTREAVRDHELDLVIWPESSVPVALPHDSGAIGLLYRLSGELGIPLLVAASGRDKMSATGRDAQVANSAFLIGPGQKIEGRYDKIRLLPFNEVLPLRDWIAWPAWITSRRRDAIAGTGPGAFETAGVRFGVQICWESLFASDGRRSAAQGVDFLVTLTNESFSRSETAHERFFALNLLRAAENGVPLLRAATTTISAVVAADGEILQRVDRRPGVIVADIPAASAPTLYARIGDWSLLALATLSLAAVVVNPQRVRSAGVVGWPAKSDPSSA